jgi:signal peptidase
MGPALAVGSVVVVQPVDPARVKVGDIITYHLSEEPGKRVTHRVVEVVPQSEGLSFRTKGDANEEPDMYTVPARNILGIVRFNLPVAGYLAHYVRTPLGFALLIALPGVALIASELKDIVGTIRSRKEKGPG